MFKRRGQRADGQLLFGDRRQAPRQAVGWEGRYRVVDESREHLHYAGDDFQPCVLIDLSMDGAGIHPLGDVAIGDSIELELPLGAMTRASIQVRGEVRQASSDDEALRAALEFTDVGDLERALLHRLLRDLKEPVAQSA